MTIDPRGRSRVIINGNGYPFDHHGFARTPVSRRDLVDTGSEQTERSLDDTSMWRRGQRDFRGGMNQAKFDSEDSDRTMFAACYSMHPTDTGLRTSPGLTEVNSRNLGRLTGGSDAAAGGTYYVYHFLQSAASIVYSSDFPDFTTWSTVSSTSGWTVYDIVFAFDEIIVAKDGPQLMSGAVGSTSTPTLFDTPSQLIAHLEFVGGRLFGAGNVTGDAFVYEYSSAGVETQVWDAEGLYITAMSPAPGGLYVAGNSHERGAVYLSVVSPVDGAMSDPVQAMELPTGEFISDMEFTTGVLVLATNRGLRIGVPDSNGFLTYGPLNSPSRDGVDWNVPILSIAVSRDRILGLVADTPWTPSTNVVRFTSPHPAGTSWSGGQFQVVEADLSNFIDTLQPSMWFRYVDQSAGANEATDVFFADYIPMVAGEGVQVDSIAQGQSDPWGDYSPAFCTGFVDFTTIENKNMSILRLSLLADSTSAVGWTTTAYYRVEGGDTSFVSLGGLTVDTTSTTTFNLEWDLTAVTGAKRIEFAFALTPDSGAAEALTVTQWSVSAAPVSFVPERIRLPLVIYEAVEVDGLDVGLDPGAVWAELHALMLARTFVDLTLGDRTEKVYVEGVSVLPDQATLAPMGWDSEKTWLQATWLVDCVTIDTV